MKNRITFSTHISLHTLDLIIEDRNENLLYNLEKGHQFSNHNFIHSTPAVRKEVPPKKTLTYRNLKSIDIKELAKDIIGSLDHFKGNIKQLVYKYNNIRKCLDIQAPINLKVMKTTYRHPWYDDKIKTEVKPRRQKERNGIRTQQSITTWPSMAREDMRQILFKQHTDYYHQLLEENKNNFKAVLNIANKLLVRNNSLPLLILQVFRI